MRLDLWTTRVIVGAVVLGWLASLVASMISTYEQPPTLNALFLALAGAALSINHANHPPSGGSDPPDRPSKELSPPDHHRRKDKDHED